MDVGRFHVAQRLDSRGNLRGYRPPTRIKAIAARTNKLAASLAAFLSTVIVGACSSDSLNCGDGLPIDPYQSCETYSQGCISDELDFQWFNNSGGPVSLDIVRQIEDVVRDILASIDYRFTQGIGEINIFVDEGTVFWGMEGGVEDYGVISFHIGRDYLEESSRDWHGAFEEIIYHEVGHHVRVKIGNRVEEYNSLLDIRLDRMGVIEQFANDFADYRYRHNFLKEASIERYNWFKDNIFCGTTHTTDAPRRAYADLYLYRGWCDQALEEYQRAFAEDPDSYPRQDYYLDIGAAYTCLGRCEDALETFRTVIREYPDSDQARSALMSIARNVYFDCLADYEAAIAAYREFIETYPDSIDAQLALLNIGLIYKDDRHDCESAISAFEEFLRIYPDSYYRNQVMFDLGECYFDTGQCDSAVAILQYFIIDYPLDENRDRAQEIIEICRYEP